MKFLSVIFIVFLAINVHAGISKEKAMEIGLMLLNECKAQEGGTDADVDSLMKLKFPGTTTGNCMIACVHEKMGFFKDGLFNKEMFMAISLQISENDPVLMEIAGIVAEKCSSFSGDRCDQAVKFDECMEVEIKARNLMPTFL